MRIIIGEEGAAGDLFYRLDIIAVQGGVQRMMMIDTRDCRVGRIAALRSLPGSVDSRQAVYRRQILSC